MPSTRCDGAPSAPGKRGHAQSSPTPLLHLKLYRCCSQSHGPPGMSPHCENTGWAGRCCHSSERPPHDCCRAACSLLGRRRGRPGMVSKRNHKVGRSIATGLQSGSTPACCTHRGYPAAGAVTGYPHLQARSQRPPCAREWLPPHLGLTMTASRWPRFHA